MILWHILFSKRISTFELAVSRGFSRLVGVFRGTLYPYLPFIRTNDRRKAQQSLSIFMNKMIGKKLNEFKIECIEYFPTNPKNPTKFD